MGVPVPTLRSWGLLCLGVLFAVAGRTMGRPEIAGIGAVFVLVPVVAWAAAWAWRKRPETFGDPPGQHLDGADALVPGTTVTVTLTGQADGRDLRPAGRRSRSRTGPVSYTWTPRTRGTYRLPPWIAIRTDALHLVRVRGALDPGVRLVVGPSPAPTDVPGLDDAGSRQVRSRGDQLDTTTRPYTAGDPVRRVHWPVSARQGRLMVRPPMQEADGSRVVLLDRTAGHYRGAPTTVASADGPDDASRADFDAAVSTAAAAYRALSGGRPSAHGAAVPVSRARLAAFPPPRGALSLPDDDLLATAVPAPERAGDHVAPSGTAGHTVLITGVPGHEAAAWPRTLTGPVDVLLHPDRPGAAPPAEVTAAWDRAGWTWHVVLPPETGADPADRSRR
jgi:uncharacterized protein (DUF58 family)